MTNDNFLRKTVLMLKTIDVNKIFSKIKDIRYKEKKWLLFLAILGQN